MSKIFLSAFCFLFRIDEATEGIFLVTFFSHFFFLLKIRSFFLLKKKELFIFSSHDTKLLLRFNEFFFETPKRVAPKKQKKSMWRCLERKNKPDKLRHVSNDTVQCSSVLVLEVVFDGLGQVQFGDFALLNALFINRLTYNAATQIHQGQRFRVKSA